MSLAPWDERAFEDRALFNPAFCAALIFEFVKEYERARKSGAPMPLAFCALTIALHPKTRRLLPKTTLTSLYDWIENTSEVLIEFGQKAKALSPYLKESIRFSIIHSTLQIDHQGNLRIGSEKANFTPKTLEGKTADTRECVITTRMLGRWFAKAGSTSTILSAWRITP